MTNASRIVDIDESSAPEDTTDQLEYRTAEVTEIMPTGHLTSPSEVDKELGEAQAQAAVENLPQKLRGKAPEEIAEMYVNLEKELGRKGQEIGELRKITDTILQSQFAAKKDTPTEPEETPDFFDDPERAVRQILQRELAPLKEQEAKSKQQQFTENLQKNYPDYEQLISSPDFADWVQASPYRVKMFTDADNWNWDAANELLSSYKAVHKTEEPQKQELDLPEMSAPKQMTPEQKMKRDAELAAASVEKGSTGETTRKVFRRVDLVRLLQTDPDRYYSLEPEIRKAYKEGRVR